VLVIVSVVIGFAWNKKRWIGYAAIFWSIYIILFTSIFSNWQGFFVGTVGALGYWLQQQGVHRGGQPWYYYLLIQIPIYESPTRFGGLPGKPILDCVVSPLPSRRQQFYIFKAELKTWQYLSERSELPTEDAS